MPVPATVPLSISSNLIINGGLVIRGAQTPGPARCRASNIPRECTPSGRVTVPIDLPHPIASLPNGPGVPGAHPPIKHDSFALRPHLFPHPSISTRRRHRSARKKERQSPDWRVLAFSQILPLRPPPLQTREFCGLKLQIGQPSAPPQSHSDNVVPQVSPSMIKTSWKPPSPA